jgi:osmotically-inducible protein OsmY
MSYLASCSPLGVAAGAGATLGIASAREGGISSTASDLKIKAMISDRWFKYDLETFVKLNLTVNQGRVLITGIVQDPDDRVEAVRLVWQVEGVKQVINEIRVATSEGLPGYVRDQWITTRLRTAITFDKEVQSINYSIDTVGGVIYLMGVSQSQAELNKVIDTARTLPHVSQVISYVKPAGVPVGQAGNSMADSERQNSGYMISKPSSPGAVESESLLWPE